MSCRGVCSASALGTRAAAALQRMLFGAWQTCCEGSGRALGEKGGGGWGGNRHALARIGRARPPPLACLAVLKAMLR
eukprot:8435584-Alexandrium_andersonii.AAC.1